MDKYIIAPPAGSTNNAIGANDRKWAKGYFEELPDWQDYLAEATGYGIVRGCNPSITGLVVSVGNGLVHMYTGKRKEFAAATVTLDAADSTDPRIDLVYLDEDGALQKSTGTAAESPLPPAVPGNAIAVCTVTIEAAASTGTILDCRGIKYRQPNTTYAEKAIAFCVGLPTGWYLECTTAGITDSADLVLPSPIAENATVTDGTVVWKIAKIGGGGSGGGNTTLERDTEYTTGAITYSTLLDSTQRLEAVTSGITASADVIVTTPTTGTYITDGTVTWIVTDIRDGDRVGDITLHPTLLPGHILANGATVTASEYPRLLAWAQANGMIRTEADASKYVYNATNDTLVVPNAIGRVLQGGSSVAVKSAGLPNITGTITMGDDVITKTSTSSRLTGTGAFTSKIISGAKRYYEGSHNGANSNSGVNFSAANSSSIYGSSTTVQPPALTLIPQIKY